MQPLLSLCQWLNHNLPIKLVNQTRTARGKPARYSRCQQKPPPDAIKGYHNRFQPQNAKKETMSDPNKPKTSFVTRAFRAVAIFFLIMAAYYFAKAWLK